MYDALKSISHVGLSKLLQRDPVVKVGFEAIKRYNVDEFGTMIPASCSTLYLTTRKKLSEGSNLKSIDEIYQFEFCLKCNEIKPPRAHHCSCCNRCILKMDHHCPFIGNCIGLHNQKAFWLFCLYATLDMLQVCLTTYFYCHDL
jgi:hypothetical protein